MYIFVFTYVYIYTYIIKLTIIICILSYTTLQSILGLLSGNNEAIVHTSTYVKLIDNNLHISNEKFEPSEPPLTIEVIIYCFSNNYICI